MEIKKALSADLENKRGIHWTMGCIVVCAGLFVALEWSNRAEIIAKADGVLYEAAISEDLPPLTTQPETKLAPPPAAVSVVNPDFIRITNDVPDVPDVQIDIPEPSTGTHGEPGASSPSTGTSTGGVDIPGPPIEDVGDPLPVAEIMPMFPGGMNKCLQWLGEHIKYPSVSQDQGREGRVLCTFVVNQDGSIVDVKIIKGVDPYIDKEAERVIKAMPKWAPGKQRGRTVRVRFTLPVQFRIG